MLPLLLIAQSFMGVSVTSTNGQPCVATITISATIVSASTLSMDTTPLELENAYAMTVEALTTGVPDARTVHERYVVLNASSGITVANNFGVLEVHVKEDSEALVLAWPEGYKLPGRKQLIAIAAAYDKSIVRGIAVASRIQRRLKIDKA
jgi:hypothetical protein